MTRTVARRPTKYATRPEKDDTTSLIGLCGDCIGPVGAVIHHERCMGRDPLTRVICPCTVCFGPDDPYVVTHSPRRKHR